MIRTYAGKTKDEVESGLAGFTGTEAYHEINGFPNFMLTDGTAYLRDNADCRWLFEIMAGRQRELVKDRMFRESQFWTLTVEKGVGTLKCERDTDDPKPVIENVGLTDFPLDKVEIWVQPGDCRGRLVQVAYLPSEH